MIPRLRIDKAMRRQQGNWFWHALQWRGSVVPEIAPRVILCGGAGVLVSALHAYTDWSLSWDLTGGLVPSIVLGLLLVFRTNTAYDRFWEGRKLWGNLVNTTRNLARQIWVVVDVPQTRDHLRKQEILQLLPAFAIALKRHLRYQPINDELRDLMSEIRFRQLQKMHNPPLEIAIWIMDYLQEQYRQQRLNVYQLTAMTRLVDQMVDALGGCERIIKTPLPFAYSIHLKQLLLIYCLSLPFELVDELSWMTGFVVSMISFTVFGIEAIALEIENPFGLDANDLPLDDICDTMQKNIQDLIEVNTVRSPDRYGTPKAPDLKSQPLPTLPKDPETPT